MDAEKRTQVPHDLISELAPNVAVAAMLKGNGRKVNGCCNLGVYGATDASGSQERWD